MAESKDIGTDANQQPNLILPSDHLKLRDLLSQRLSECGWRDEIRSICHNLLTERGTDSSKLQEIIAEVAPQARSLVPSEVKQEILLKIREIVSAEPKNGSFGRTVGVADLVEHGEPGFGMLGVKRSKLDKKIRKMDEGV